MTEHGHAADYVNNIQADPRVRVKVGREWRGTAHVLPDDDPGARCDSWAPLNDALVRVVGTEHLVLRVDLDDRAY